MTASKREMGHVVEAGHVVSCGSCGGSATRVVVVAAGVAVAA